MQLKSYTDTSFSAILAKIKEEMGPDAVILDKSEEDGRVTITAALERSKENSKNIFDQEAQLAGSHAFAQPQGWQQWHREWDLIKSHLLTLMKPQLKMGELSPRQRIAIEFLQKEGMSDESALPLLKKLQQDSQCSILEPLADLVKIRPWGNTSWPQRIHVITGPYGGGKTSVTIRMALMLRKEKPDLRICLINADATRGNGRLLLKHYSELSDLDYKEAASSVELADALIQAEKEGFDKILIDLPGLSRGKLLQALLTSAGLTEKNVAVHLAMAPSYDQKHTKRLLERYHVNVDGSIIWTKLDELESFGNVINVAFSSGLPVSALSYGPGLGNSLSPAKEVMLWRLIFKGELPTS